MKNRIALGAAAAFALALCAAAGLSGIDARAQEVKEQWLIDGPNPNDPKPPAPKPAEGAKAAPTAGQNEHGLQIVKNPYSPDNAEIVAQGRELFVSRACSGCHGAGGGGGMCPAVINDVWVYGADDTTLFNLIKLGSAGMQSHGYTRIGRENVVGEMPGFGSMATEDEEWKLITYVRSKYAGDPANKSW